jgi:plasmid maintenance system killer protein
LKGHYSAWVNGNWQLATGNWQLATGNWRMTFKFEGDDAVLVDYHDYA